MPRVVHFGTSAQNPERAAEFYNRVFGWEFKKWEGGVDYWMIETGEATEPGIDGGMMQRGDETPPGTIVTIEVPSVDEYIGKIEAAGGKITVPKMAIPTVGWLAYFQDTEGNTFGIMEEDESAA